MHSPKKPITKLHVPLLRPVDLDTSLSSIKHDTAELNEQVLQLCSTTDCLVLFTLPKLLKPAQPCLGSFLVTYLSIEMAHTTAFADTSCLEQHMLCCLSIIVASLDRHASSDF